MFPVLLGDAENGRWQIRPASSDARTTRRYQPGTLILETTFATAEGEVILIDLMPLRGRASYVVRLVVATRGLVAMRAEVIIRFDYVAAVPWERRTGDGDLLAIPGADMLVLRTPVELRGERMTMVGNFAVAAGQTVPFVLMYVPSHLRAPDPVDIEDALRQTQAFWQEWTRRRPSTGPYADAVTRSGAGSDGLPPGEEAFLACSFPLRDAYVLLGRRHDPRRLFEQLLSPRNDLSLLSEDCDPAAKRLLGNFPGVFPYRADQHGA